MSYERKDGDISVFPAKKTKQKSPDFTGTIMWEGTELRVSLWERKGRSGTFFGGVVQESQARSEYSKPQRNDDGMSDDIPF